MDFGKVITFRPLPSKALSPTADAGESIVTDSNFPHPENIPWGIWPTSLLNVTEARAESLKISFPRWTHPFANVRLGIAVPWKALSPSFFTYSKEMLSSIPSSAKAPSSMVVTVSGRFTFSRLVQPRKAFLQIVVTPLGIVTSRITSFPFRKPAGTLFSISFSDQWA